MDRAPQNEGQEQGGIVSSPAIRQNGLQEHGQEPWKHAATLKLLIITFLQGVKKHTLCVLSLPWHLPWPETFRWDSQNFPKRNREDGQGAESSLKSWLRTHILFLTVTLCNYLSFTFWWLLSYKIGTITAMISTEIVQMVIRRRNKGVGWPGLPGEMILNTLWPKRKTELI